MSRLITNSIRSTSASADAITLDGSGNATFPANVTCSGTAAGFGGGKLLQHVNQTDTTAKTTSGSTKLDIINLTITPAATSSKIFVIADATLYISNNGNAIGHTWLYRGDSTGTLLTQNNHGTGANNGMYSSSNINFLDSPSTTSATVYTLVMGRGSGYTQHLETSGNRYSITAFEVGA